MKTPERILDETHEDYHRYQLDIHEHGLPDIAAMETYAKQQAIAFASWIALHGYRPAPTDTVLAGAWVMMKHRQDFTSDELYEKFKKEQQS